MAHALCASLCCAPGCCFVLSRPPARRLWFVWCACPCVPSCVMIHHNAPPSLPNGPACKANTHDRDPISHARHSDVRNHRRKRTHFSSPHGTPCATLWTAHGNHPTLTCRTVPPRKGARLAIIGRTSAGRQSVSQDCNGGPSLPSPYPCGSRRRLYAGTPPAAPPREVRCRQKP